MFSKLTFNPAKSMSIWGSLLAVMGWLLQPEVLAVLPSGVAAVAQALGMMLAAFGLRNAATKPSVSEVKAESTPMSEKTG